MDQRVSDVPRWLRPLHRLVFTAIAYFFHAIYWVVRSTCRATFVNQEAVPKGRAAIFSLWHENFMTYFSFFPDCSKQVWMMHPAWYMEHVVVTTQLLGVEKLQYGSTKHGGREAADALVRDLKAGYSTSMAPDGPSGPARVLKKGVLHMAEQSGVPVIAVRFEFGCAIRLPFTWEGKRIPLPFSKVKITFSDPFFVTSQNRNEVAIQIAQAMN